MSMIGIGRKKKRPTPDFVPITTQYADSTIASPDMPTQGVHDGIGSATSGKDNFCMNCGQQLPNEAKFCFECGKPVGTTNPRGNSHRKEFYDGEVIKCPSCGERLSAFTPVCPVCSYELRGAKASNVVQEFSRQFSSIGSGKGSKDRKVGLISSFPIPNTKEDIFEFMVLTASNIDARLTVMRDPDSSSEKARKLISDAWYAKFEQAYLKAKLSFGNSHDFTQIKEIYNGKMKEIKRARSRRRRLHAMLLFGIILGIIMMVCGFAFMNTEYAGLSMLSLVGMMCSIWCAVGILCT